jgi:hypothetical protein
MLKESLDKFTAPVYGKTRRTAETYQTIAQHCTSHLNRLVEEYQTVRNDQQLLRELRNDIDEKIRRYHEYCIKQRDGMGAHYHELGADDKTDFEHLIPLVRVRDLLLAGAISIEQALNAPTVRLSRVKHESLKDEVWASATPSKFLPFHRYSQVFAANFETHDGTAVDQNSWTLAQHFDYFKHLIINIEK